MPESIGLLGVGLGGLGRRELGLCADSDGVTVLAGSDISPEAREAFESEFDAPAYESVEDLLAAHGDAADAALVVTPHALHHEHALACFDAGLDVFLEKPMVTGIENAVDVVERARERDLVLQVGYQRHFHPAYRELKRLVDAGEIGELQAASCYLGQDHVRPQSGTWRTDPDLAGGGQLYDSGSHLLDALLWTTGAEPTKVAALVDDREYDVDVNSALSVFLDREGSRITASVGVTGDGPSHPGTEEGLVLWGTGGRASYDGEELTVVSRETTDRRPYATTFESGTDFETLSRAKLEDFFAAVRGEADPAVPGDFGLWVTALTECAYEAAASETVVDVRAAVADARERLDRN
jgi:predicted dehydrogenase